MVHRIVLYHTLSSMRYLGIDYGGKRVGLALSDEAGTMGFPHAIISNTPELLEEVIALVERERVEAIVIGESRNLSGQDNPIMAPARAFGAALAGRTNLPVHYESEVFTSEAARQAPAKERKTRAPKQHEPIDDAAAALILTSYLSRSSHG